MCLPGGDYIHVGIGALRGLKHDAGKGGCELPNIVLETALNLGPLQEEYMPLSEDHLSSSGLLIYSNCVKTQKDLTYLYLVVTL